MATIRSIAAAHGIEPYALKALEEARRDGDASEVARLFKQLRTVHQAIADEQRYYGDRWGDGGVSYG